MYTVRDISFEHTELDHLIKRKEFGRFSDPGFRGSEDLNDELRDLVSPALCHKIEPVSHIDHHTVHLRNGMSLTSPILAKVFEHCEEMVIFVVSIGSALEEEVTRLNNENRLTEAYVLDRLGSLTAEHAVNVFYNNVKRHYRNKGYGTTLRFSPGYCDWPVSDQRKLFLFLDADSIGVTLTDSCLMQPRKSVSGVFGLFPLMTDDGTTTPAYNPCQHCEKTGCTARRKNLA
jgi:hypothetical protein